MKRILAIISLLLVLCMVFASCNNVTPDDKESETKDTSVLEGDTEKDTTNEGNEEIPLDPNGSGQWLVASGDELYDLEPADIAVDGIIGIDEYTLSSGYLDRNIDKHGEFVVVSPHRDSEAMWSAYYLDFDNDYVYLAYAERANYGSEMYFDINPGADADRQITIHAIFSRKTTERENATYDIDSIEMYECKADGSSVTLDKNDFVVDSARSWWDDGMRNVNYIEIKLDRAALAEYVGVERFTELGIRGTTVSIPPVGGGNPVSCYGNVESTVFPFDMNENVGYHVFELKNYPDPNNAVDARFLEEYGQKTFLAGNAAESKPSIDGSVSENEYSLKFETTMGDYGMLHDSTGGTWGIEWANYYVSYNDDYIYIAAEIKDNDHVAYGTWSDVTRADQLNISIGGLIDTPDTVSTASSITFRLYDGSGAATGRDFYEIKDTEVDVYGDYVDAGRRFSRASYVKENSVEHNDTTGVTTYEIALIRSALEAVWPHNDEMQSDFISFGISIKDVSSELTSGAKGHVTGVRYLGASGETVKDVYQSLLVKYDCTAHYGVAGVEKLIPYAVYLGNADAYEGFRAERLQADDVDAPVGEAPENVQLYVGYARESITPLESDFAYYELAGYADGRPISRVRDNLYASCTAFQDAEGDIALIYTLDLHAMHPVQAAEIIARINDATGVPKENIILNVTHTHTAHGFSLDGSGRAGYKERFYNAMIGSAQDAIADLAPCIELYAGEIDMSGYSFIRRYLTDKGNLYGVAQGGSDTIIAHEHEMDSMIPVARFVRYGAKDVILVNFAAHCDTVSGSAPTAISADYVSSFRRTMEKELDVHFSMQLGATGDVNPLSALPGEYTFPGTTKYGESLAYKVIEELDTLPMLEIKGDVEALKSTVTAVVNHDTDHMLDKANEIWDLYYSDRKAEASAKMEEYGILNIYETMYIRARGQAGEYEMRNVSAISIGNIVFGAADYEMFSQTGRDIKDGGNEYFDLTFNCAYSNGMIGYIPAEYAFENGGYEVYSCMYVPGTAEDIADEIIRLFGELATN